MGNLIKITIGLCLLCAGLAQATLVYKAGFNTYTNGQTITANTTGDDNTFSGIVNAGGTQKAYDASGLGVGMDDGLSMRIGGAANTVTISQKALGAMPLMITSFDFYSPDISLKFSAHRTNSAGSPLALFTATDTGTSLDGKLIRATMVVNRSSGSSITLPGSLGTLATNKYAVYYQYGGTYTLIGSIASVSANYDPIGFQMVNTFTAASEYTSYALYDNIGVWDSATDTVGTTSVLQLSPGSVIPEPATIGLLTVNSGTGSGTYTNGQEVMITASNIAGKAFAQWTGDTQYVASVTSTPTTVTMPTQGVTVTATYTDVGGVDPIGYITLGGLVGGNLVFSWETSNGQTYNIETNADLMNPSGWGIFDTIVGGGGTVTVTNTPVEARLFYKVTSP